MKLSYKDLSVESASFEGGYSYTEGDFNVEVKSYQADFLPTDAGVYLDLRFEYEFSAPCDKCLEQTAGRGKERSGIQFLKQPENVKDETELNDDDMGIVYVEEDEIDLEEIIRQEVAFALPVKMICSDECKGLCLKCGENLNSGNCKCEQDVDPQVGIFKEYKEIVSSNEHTYKEKMKWVYRRIRLQDTKKA